MYFEALISYQDQNPESLDSSCVFMTIIASAGYYAPGAASAPNSEFNFKQFPGKRLFQDLNTGKKILAVPYWSGLRLYFFAKLKCHTTMTSARH
jgi:hypothetical protein